MKKDKKKSKGKGTWLIGLVIGIIVLIFLAIYWFFLRVKTVVSVSDPNVPIGDEGPVVAITDSSTPGDQGVFVAPNAKVNPPGAPPSNQANYVADLDPTDSWLPKADTRTVMVPNAGLLAARPELSGTVIPVPNPADYDKPHPIGIALMGGGGDQPPSDIRL